jgi:translocation and assembly module TamB
VQLSALAMELPALGLRLSGGDVQLDGNADQISVRGRIVSGPGDGAFEALPRAALPEGAGILHLEGKISPFAKAKAVLNITGENVLFADTPSAHVLASPNVIFSHDGDVLRIKGSVALPEAQINLARLESSTSASDDVVVIDDPKASVGLPLRADITVSLGNAVSLKGLGLNGKATGSIKIRERPNRRATARGAIEVSGTYKAYGQNLQIERGKLQYSGTSLDNPSLDIRASRKIERVSAGVQVRGRALQPELSVWSDPVMEQSDALFYLVAGRPLRGASAADSAAVGAAAGALETAGGNLIAQGLGQRVGLELGVETISELGGTAFTAGKYLSPSLYLGYARGRINARTLLIVRYRLFEKYEFEAQSGREQKIGVNYRNER